MSRSERRKRQALEALHALTAQELADTVTVLALEHAELRRHTEVMRRGLRRLHVELSQPDASAVRALEQLLELYAELLTTPAVGPVVGR